MSITPKAIQDLLDELEASRQARRRAWDVLHDLRAVLTDLGNVTVETPSRKAFEIEGAILKQALSDCLRTQRAALTQRGRLIRLLLDRRQNWGQRTRRSSRLSTARRFCCKVESHVTVSPAFLNPADSGPSRGTTAGRARGQGVCL
jgi:hypothetical protein